MNVGLLYTPVSIFQMTRGALVLFVGILSVLFLHRRLHLYQWFALIVVMGGIAVVGLSGSLVKKALGETDPSQQQPLEFEDGAPSETSVLIGASFRASLSCRFSRLPISIRPLRLQRTRRREEKTESEKLEVRGGTTPAPPEDAHTRVTRVARVALWRLTICPITRRPCDYLS